MAARARDWKSLTAAHRQRGKFMTIMFDPEGTAFAPPEAAGRRGRPQLYTDDCIEGILTVKLALQLSLRATQGLVLGLRDLVKGTWNVPDFSTLSRREARLEVDLGAQVNTDKRQMLIVDSTGLKVFGEGEWKVRQHGVGKRRTWCKVHILVDRESGHIIAVETTPNNTPDCLVLPGLMPADLTGTMVLGDGAYHTKDLHREVHKRGGRLLSPPPENARVWKPYHHLRDEPAFAFRNAQLTPLKRLGRTQWKIQSGCAMRSYVEAMMHRLKSLTGARLAARTEERQKVEVRLRCKLLNATATSTWSSGI